MAQESLLASWNDGATKQAIVDFVSRVTTQGSADYVPPEERVAVFDNDGTLWTEKPMPTQLGFILAQFVAAAEKDESLREKQPWQAAYNKDFKWLGDAMTKHYNGDDSDLKVLIGGLIHTFGGMSVHDYQSYTQAYFDAAKHPTLQRPYAELTFKPMVELLRYLEANGFTCYIASGGDRDFMRVIGMPYYSIPPERVIGSSFGLEYKEDEQGNGVLYTPALNMFDDGPAKPINIWSRIGRRPLIAGGNSNGDVPMLNFAGRPGKPALRLLVLHDDAEREFDYVGGAEKALELAKTNGWTVISVKNDWNQVF